MTAAWSEEELAHIGVAEELLISTRRPDGTPLPTVPIWVVCAGGQVMVRTWHRRDHGWFGHAVAARHARIGVPGLEVDVAVEDVGEGGAELRAGVDAAYQTKYGHFGAATVDRMIGPDAAASTLRLVPARRRASRPDG